MGCISVRDPYFIYDKCSSQCSIYCYRLVSGLLFKVSYALIIIISSSDYDLVGIIMS